MTHGAYQKLRIHRQRGGFIDRWTSNGKNLETINQELIDETGSEITKLEKCSIHKMIENLLFCEVYFDYFQKRVKVRGIACLLEEFGDW